MKPRTFTMFNRCSEALLLIHADSSESGDIIPPHRLFGADLSAPVVMVNDNLCIPRTGIGPFLPHL